MRPKSACIRTLVFTVSAASLAAGLPVRAQPGAGDRASPPDEAGAAAATAVREVVVTADRTPTDADRVGQSVTVLTEPQIRLDQETAVIDLLARTPGVSIASNGGPGQTASIFIRGAESGQTVLLIDGVKVNDPTDPSDAYDFSNLVTGDISRIEVLRGPQSTLYGSQAIGGVVNVVTADATKPLQGDLQAEGGSYGTTYVKGAVGGKDGPAAWRLGAYYNSTDSVSAFDRAFGGREADGFHTAGVSARLSYDLARDLQLDQRAYYSWSRVEFDGYDNAACNAFLPSCSFGDDAEYGRTQQVVDYTGLNLSLFDGRLKNRIAYEYDGLDRRQEDPNQPLTKFTFTAQGRVNTVEYEGTYAIATRYQLVFGAQSERSSLDTDSPYYDIAYGETPLRANVIVNSGYGQITGEVLPGLTLTGGVRDDDHSTFGGHVTGQASAAWALNGGATVLRASFGQGFKAPSLYQLYSPYGNRTLDPEEANGWDAGVEQHLFGDTVTVQATYFGRRTKNLIDFVVCESAATPGCANNFVGGFYDNVARAEAQGAEVQAGWRASEALRLDANYTFTDTEDRTPGSPDEGRQLARRPKNTANLAATYVWPAKLSTTAAVRYAGQSFDDASHFTRLGGYTLIDLRGAYPLRPGLELYARVENLTDKRYETTYQYGTLGRAGYAGVRLGF